MGKAKRKLRAAHDKEHGATKRLTRQRDHPLTAAAGAVAEIGDQPPLVAINLLTIGAGLVLRRPAVVAAGVRMLAAHGIATAIKAAIKANFDRTRPHAELEGKPRRAEPGGHDTHDYNSFPSGHTAGAVAVAGAIAHAAPAYAATAYAGAAAVAAVQVPRGSHYASDVAVGAVIGWLSAKLTNAALDRLAEALGDQRGVWVASQSSKRVGMIRASGRATSVRSVSGAPK